MVKLINEGNYTWHIVDKLKWKWNLKELAVTVCTSIPVARVGNHCREFISIINKTSSFTKGGEFITWIIIIIIIIIIVVDVVPRTLRHHFWQFHLTVCTELQSKSLLHGHEEADTTRLQNDLQKFLFTT